MSEAQILASLSLWTNFSCCKKILGSVLKRKDTFGDFFSHFFFFPQEHLSLIYLEANWS